MSRPPPSLAIASLIILSMKQLNRRGDRTQPCLTPDFTSNLGDTLPSALTCHQVPEYNSWMKWTRIWGTPYSFKIAIRACWSTESYTLVRTTKDIQTGLWYPVALSTTCWATQIWSTVPRPLRKPPWASKSWGSMMFCSLSRRIKASTLPGTLNSATPRSQIFLSFFLWSGTSVASFHSCGIRLVFHTSCNNTVSQSITALPPLFNNSAWILSSAAFPFLSLIAALSTSYLVAPGVPLPALSSSSVKSAATSLCTFNVCSKCLLHLASFSSGFFNGCPASSSIVSVVVPLVPECLFSFLKKSPCLLCFMSSSSSVIFSSHHLSLSALITLLTCLHKVTYSRRLSTLVRCSCHCANFWRFLSISSIVSVESHCLCGYLLLCSCCSAHPTTASFSSFHTASTLSCFLLLKHFWTSSM